jgi:hypothetical protein
VADIFANISRLVASACRRKTTVKKTENKREEKK